MSAKTIHVVHNDEGVILAASEAKNPPRPVHIPVKIREFEVPSEFSGKPMQEYIPHLKVDVTAGQLKRK